MDKKTVSNLLAGASQETLINIISKMTVYSKKSEHEVLNWCKQNNEEYKNKALEIEFMNLWNCACEIIQEFNMYGGGPDSDEVNAANALWKMNEMVKEHKISWKVRIQVLDEMMIELDEGNSGFDDLLVDIASDLCVEKEEIRYLADRLRTGSNEFYRNYAAGFYKEIGDEAEYLQTKLSNLQYGSDYIEVARYYAKHGNHEKEREYIWRGLKESSGRLDELVNYIAPKYIKEQNDNELQRLFSYIMKTKWDINIYAAATHMLQYAENTNNYQKQKEMLFLLLDTCSSDSINKCYDMCKKILTKEDWKQEYEKILQKVKDKDTKFYLDICMETGKKKLVLEYLQTTRSIYDFWDIDNQQYFSKRLFHEYPDEILALYWRDVNQLLKNTNNKNYVLTTDVLKRIKKLMTQMKRAPEWEQQFSELKEKHKKKRNFMKLIKDLS